jgi:hypothetical protein
LRGSLPWYRQRCGEPARKRCDAAAAAEAEDHDVEAGYLTASSNLAVEELGSLTVLGSKWIRVTGRPGWRRLYQEALNVSESLSYK